MMGGGHLPRAVARAALRPLALRLWALMMLVNMAPVLGAHPRGH